MGQVDEYLVYLSHMIKMAVMSIYFSPEPKGQRSSTDKRRIFPKSQMKGSNFKTCKLSKISM